MSSPAPEKRLFIKTYGCQMNVYDSERMADVLAPLGYGVTDRPEDADLVVLNTCHIREKATEKVYSELGQIRLMKQDREAAGAGMTIAVAGCVAQAEGEEIMRRQPAVDLVVGPQAYHQLPELIARAHRARGERLSADFAAEEKFDALPTARNASGVTAFLTVQEGCDKFCTFCVVPYTRGPEVSRPVADLLDEARALVASGALEITLIGQNVNAFSPATGGLAALIRALADLPGLERIRYTTSHPRDMDEALIRAHAEVPKLMPYLHLPVQSGSTRILKAMNRAHTRQSYLDILARLREVRPDIAISGDFIVGFPGETEADFEDTLSIVREAGYAQAFSFKYSIRPGTPAATLADQVPEAVKDERLARLQAELAQSSLAFNHSTVGRQTSVLLERPGRRPGQWIGKTPWLQSAVIDAPDAKPGDMVMVEITDAMPNCVLARSLDRRQAA